MTLGLSIAGRLCRVAALAVSAATASAQTTAQLPATEPAFAVGGYLRWQSIHTHNTNFGSAPDDDGVLLQRYHFYASLRATDGVRLFAELKSNHENRREQGPQPLDVDRVDVHQAFIDVGADSSASLRLGRQELSYGSGRRLFTRNGPNVRGNYDGARLRCARRTGASTRSLSDRCASMQVRSTMAVWTHRRMAASMQPGPSRRWRR